MIVGGFARIARRTWLIGVIACAQAAAQEGFTAIDRSETYCGADAIFIGVAKKIYFNDRPDMKTCEDPAPKTVAQFASQGMICYPLFAEVEVKEYLFTSEKKPRTAFKLHMKWASPEFEGDSIEQMGKSLQRSPHIYSVAFLKAYEEDGTTWLMGYPRSETEREYVLGATTKPPCR